MATSTSSHSSSAATSGNNYKRLVADYLVGRFDSRGIQVYLEVQLGKSIIGKDRKIDILCVSRDGGKAFAIECKFQESQGTADEKIPYALQDIEAMHVAGCIAYAGSGFSAGVLHMLNASRFAVHCLPTAGQRKMTSETKELDQLLAMHFGWWDEIIGAKPRHVVD